MLTPSIAYYIGQIAGIGGDSEICLTNIRRITYQEYLKLRKETKQISNDYVNAVCDLSISLLNAGWDLGISNTKEHYEDLRSKYVKK